MGKWTKGPWYILPRYRNKLAVGLPEMDIPCPGTGGAMSYTDIVCEMSWSGGEHEANAALIAEAGTVAHETGLTPRQLADQRAELLYALKQIREHLNGLGAEDAVMRLVNNAIAGAGADLSGANLSGAIGILRLPVSDPRRYQYFAVWRGDGWRIYAGCRDFNEAGARAHWLSDNYDGPESVKETMAYALDWLARQPKPKERKP